MISAPLACAAEPPLSRMRGDLTIPVIHLESGKFPQDGKPWVIIKGTSAWGQDFGMLPNQEEPDPDSEVTPVFHMVEDHELEEVK